MQKAFTKRCEHQALHNLPTSDEIKKLQTDYNNMLTAIIDLLDGAKYLWEGEPVSYTHLTLPTKLEV